MSLDERELAHLIEESRDLHTDAMHASEEPLDELVELGQQQRARGDLEAPQESPERRRLLQGGVSGAALAATGAFGAALVALMSRPAFADAPADVSMLQTSASIENLAVATYDKALTLDFIGGGSALPVVKAFVTMTKAQHADHAAAFNAAATQLGGKKQTNPDPALMSVVNGADLSSAAGVVDLAIELENTAAQTYVANTAALSDDKARQVTASIMGVEAQHAAVLNAVKALLAAGMTDEIALPPPDLAALPAAAGSVGFPDSFFKTADARPATEGAVQ